MYSLPSQCQTLLRLALISTLPATFFLSSCTPAAPIEPEAIRTQPLQNYQKQWKIELPDSVETETVVDIFAIPDGDVSNLLFSRRTLPRAREIISSGLTRTARLHRLGERYWLSAEMPPSSVWPLLKQYLTAAKIGIDAEYPLQGLLRSEQLVDSEPQMALEMKIESGLRSGSTEVHMRLLDPNGEVIEQSALVAQRFRDILTFMSGIEQITSSMLVQHLDFKPKMVTGVDSEGYPRIEIQVDETRAWSLLSRAIESLNLDVIGTDSGRQLIEFNYQQQASEQSDWQPRWAKRAWQNKVGLAVLAPDYRPGSSRAGGGLNRAYLKLAYRDDLSVVSLVDHDLSINTAFELISQLVQQIQ